jgi:cytochrome-b5 reductase
MEGVFSSKNVNGIYIPAGLLVFGTFIVKREYTPYAVLLALVLGAIKFYNLRESRPEDPVSCKLADNRAEPKKVLKPDVFQEFELKEKTIISHNVAM